MSCPEFSLFFRELLHFIKMNNNSENSAKIGTQTTMPNISLSMNASDHKNNHISIYIRIARLSILTLILWAFGATAQNLPPQDTIPFEQCFREAAIRYSIEPSLLIALAHTESHFDPRALNQRSETDKDIGIMQIWSNWLPKLKKYNISESDLLNPCININIGAWILSQNFASHGMNLTSLGAYNAGFKQQNEHIRVAYVEKVIPKLHYYRKIINLRKTYERK